MKRPCCIRVLWDLLVPHTHNNHRARLWHHSALIWIFVLNVMGFAWVNSLSHSYPQVLGYASSISAEEIIRLTNQQRQQRGLGTLKSDAQLTQAAVAKAADMFAKDYWSHVSPTGDQPWKFIRESGYYYTYAGENLARDFDVSGQVVNAWMNSAGHRKNILNPNYLDIGVAVMDGRLQGKETTLVVQMFGQRRVMVSTVGADQLLDKQAMVTAPPTPTSSPTPTPTATPRPTVSLSVTQQPTVELEPTVAASAAGVMQYTPPDLTLPSVWRPLDNWLSPWLSPAELYQSWGSAILLLLAGVMLIDVVVVIKSQIHRISGHSVAHFMVLLMALILLWSTGQGIIL